MSALPDDRQALHRENLRVSGHLSSLAALKKRRAKPDEESETIAQAAALTPPLPVPIPRPTARIQTAPPLVTAPEPDDGNGFFDDFESEAVMPKPPSEVFNLDDSTAFEHAVTHEAAFEQAVTHDTGRLSASAEDTSDAQPRPPAAASSGEAIHDILDGFNW